MKEKDFESDLRKIIPDVKNSDYKSLLQNEYDSDKFSLDFELNSIQFDNIQLQINWN